VYALRIPFVEAFRHASKDRTSSDSVVLTVRDDAGNVGFGEGVPRPYVTGETQEAVIGHLRDHAWSALRGRELSAASLDSIESWVSDEVAGAVLANNASRSAWTCAVLDCALRARNRSVAELLPARRQKVTYSGVITAGSIATIVEHAKRMKLVGLSHIKLKVGFPDDLERVRVVREVLGRAASLRLDANGAWSPDTAAALLPSLETFDIESVEQPIARGSIEDLLRLRAATRIPLMADESLVTWSDAVALAQARAVDLFNIRVSKCGGLQRSLAIARLAQESGIRIQVGSQVGETAILSAAGRHLAAALPEVAFAEGSYGTLLLTEDIATQSVRFGHGGEAPVLRGPGLGVEIREAVLEKYAIRQVQLS
jgi:muconate cycloisomerase